MPTIAPNCLYSTVKNTSGVTKIFGFLPPHGRELADDEEFTVFGDIRQGLGGNRGGERSVARRDNAAFEDAIASGDLALIATPNVILVDTVTADVRTLILANGTLSVIDPLD